jgi:tungstate transport system substrate-binding protein
MPTRRASLLLPLLLPASISQAAQRASLADPLRLGVDVALADSGLAGRLQRGFGTDTGVAVRLFAGPASTVLQALERGEHDAALTNAPAIEQALASQGLAHDRRPVASTDLVLVGPEALAAPLAAGADIALALSRLAQVQAAFVTPGDGSGTHLAEQALWRAARVAPSAPWYRTSADALAEAVRTSACTLVERGVWLAHRPARGWRVLVEGDPRMGMAVHVMQTFRGHHPGAGLFERWITGPAGRRLVSATAGYRAPEGASTK